MRMPLLAALCCAVLLVACQSQPTLPKNVGCRTPHCTKSSIAAPNAPPVIQSIVFPDGSDLRVGESLSGTIYTSSNVASVELRTNLFSILPRKTGVGRFDVSADIYDVPSIFIRPYTLRVIARNTRGDQAEEDLPFRIRGSR